jgi:hypothetical protein
MLLGPMLRKSAKFAYSAIDSQVKIHNKKKTDNSDLALAVLSVAGVSAKIYMDKKKEEQKRK